LAPPVKPATRTCGTAETHAHEPPVGPLAHPVHASPQRPPQHLTRSDQRGRRTRTHGEHRQPREQRARTHIRSALHARLVRPGGKTGEEPRRSTAPARNIQGAQPRRSTAPARNLRALPHRAGRELVSRAPRARLDVLPYHVGQGVGARRPPVRGILLCALPPARGILLCAASSCAPSSCTGGVPRGILLCAASSCTRFLLCAASSARSIRRTTWWHVIRHVMT
jgi:hypothetical protein